MSADSKPTKFCSNARCSTHDLKVRTDVEKCVACGEPLRDDGILGRLGFNFDDLFGGFR